MAGILRDNIDTAVDGLGLMLHGHKAEAYHLGKPLFRVAEEWCDSDPAATSLRTDAGHQSSSHVAPLDTRDGEHPKAEELDGAEGACLQDIPTRWGQSKRICCMWLVGRCPHESWHSSDKTIYLHEDVPGLQCGFGTSCRYKHYECRTAAPCSSLMDNVELQLGMTLCVNSGGCWMCGEVLEVSAASDMQSVRMCYGAGDPEDWRQVDWFSLSSLSVPDFSGIEEGMQGSVIDTSSKRHFNCTVVKVSQDKDKAHAPVHVHYDGYSSNYDEWVGADRFLSKCLRFRQPKLPAGGIKAQLSKRPEPSQSASASFSPCWDTSAFSNDAEQAETTWSPDASEVRPDYTFVCCMWLAGKCRQEGQHFGGKNLYLHEDVPGLQCGFLTSCHYKHYESRAPNSSTTEYVELELGMVVRVSSRGHWMCGEIANISSFSERDLAPVKVRFREGEPHALRQVDWLSLSSLSVPDFSGIEEGMQGSVIDTSSKRHFNCTVVKVSQDKDKAHAPVHVHYDGYSSNYDEWVGADRFLSKCLRFRQPKLPAGGIKAQLSKRPEPLQSSDCTAASSSIQPKSCTISVTSGLAQPARGHELSAAVDSDRAPHPVNGRSLASMDLLQLDLADEFPDDSLGTSCLPESKDLCLCPLPWHELSTDADAHAFDLALFATEEASQRSERKEEWRRGLEEALAAEDNEALQCVLEQHGWSGEPSNAFLFVSLVLLYSSWWWWWWWWWICLQHRNMALSFLFSAPFNALFNCSLSSCSRCRPAVQQSTRVRPIAGRFEEKLRPKRLMG